MKYDMTVRPSYHCHHQPPVRLIIKCSLVWNIWQKIIVLWPKQILQSSKVWRLHKAESFKCGYHTKALRAAHYISIYPLPPLMSMLELHYHFSALKLIKDVCESIPGRIIPPLIFDYFCNWRKILAVKSHDEMSAHSLGL